MYEKIGMPNIEITSFVFEDSCWYESQEVFDQMADLLEKYLESNSIFDITKALEEFHIAKRKKIGALVKQKGDPLDKLEELTNIFGATTSYIWLTHGLEQLYNRKLQEIVPKYIDKDRDLFIGDASFPSKKNAYVFMEEAIYY